MQLEGDVPPTVPVPAGSAAAAALGGTEDGMEVAPGAIVSPGSKSAAAVAEEAEAEVDLFKAFSNVTLKYDGDEP